MENKKEQIAIRFSGDSGDGMQLAGERFTSAAAQAGEDVSTLSDFPAEIRAPAGSLSGVSGFQVSVGASGVYTPGDQVDVLVAMNPAALKVNLKHLKEGGLLLVNEDGFSERNLKKAGYESSPLDSVKDAELVSFKMSQLTKSALAGTELKGKEIDRCKNFFALGLLMWLFEMPTESTLDWLDSKFSSKKELAESNKKALNAGWNTGMNTEATKTTFKIRTEKKQSGVYRYITGNKALALGLVVAARKSGLDLFLGSYPITPASDILHELAAVKGQGVHTFQAEDEIAAIGAAIGAAYGGAIGVTATSGPGLALKSEFLNLAIIAELPLIVVDVQRSGPSTGMPTKMEQGDLFQSLWGRNGDSPVVVLAAHTPEDCFAMAIEAARLSIKHMTPVILLSDYYLANGARAWKIPDFEDLPEFEFSSQTKDHDKLEAYSRNPETLARPWILPGTPGGEHRIGGLEKQVGTGAVSFDPADHKEMTQIRHEKIRRVQKSIPDQAIIGDKDAEVVIVGWGSTYGVVLAALEKVRAQGHKVAMINLQYINPFPANLKTLLSSFKKVAVAENNMGQLAVKISGEFGIVVEKINKVEGVPFKEIEIEQKIIELLGSLS